MCKALRETHPVPGETLPLSLDRKAGRQTDRQACPTATTRRPPPSSCGSGYLRPQEGNLGRPAVPLTVRSGIPARPAQGQTLPGRTGQAPITAWGGRRPPEAGQASPAERGQLSELTGSLPCARPHGREPRGCRWPWAVTGWHFPHNPDPGRTTVTPAASPPDR